MPPERRRVRVTETFFQQLDEQLGSDRGSGGEPSATDFLVFELPAVVERFAVGFDDLPEIMDGFAGGRMVITSGLLVRAIAVYGLVQIDGSIDLIGVEIDQG